MWSKEKFFNQISFFQQVQDNIYQEHCQVLKNKRIINKHTVSFLKIKLIINFNYIYLQNPIS